MLTGCPSAVNKKVVLLNIAKKINLYIIDNHKNKNHCRLFKELISKTNSKYKINIF